MRFSSGLVSLALTAALSSVGHAQCKYNFDASAFGSEKKSYNGIVDEVESSYLLYRYIDYEGVKVLLLRREYTIVEFEKIRDLKIQTSILGYVPNTIRMGQGQGFSNLSQYTSNNSRVSVKKGLKVSVVPFNEQDRVFLYLDGQYILNSDIAFEGCK